MTRTCFVNSAHKIAQTDSCYKVLVTDLIGHRHFETVCNACVANIGGEKRAMKPLVPRGLSLRARRERDAR